MASLSLRHLLGGGTRVRGLTRAAWSRAARGRLESTNKIPRFNKIPRHHPPSPPPNTTRDAATQTIAADEALQACPEHWEVVATLHRVRK